VHLFVRGGHNFRLGRWVGALKQALAWAAKLSRAKMQLWEEGFLIMSCAVMKAILKNGITSVKILRVLVSLIRQRIGPIRERSFTLTAPNLQDHRPVACALSPVACHS